MKRSLRRLVLISLLVFLSLAVLVLVLQRWLDSQDFKLRVERELSRELGLALRLQRLDVTLWPWPGVAATGLQIQTRPALSLERLEVRPSWSALLLGRLELATLLVRQAQIPQEGLEALLAVLRKSQSSAHAASARSSELSANLAYLPRRVILEELTWVSAKGRKTVLNAEVSLDAQAALREASVKIVAGQLSGATGRLQREDDAWLLALTLGAGTVQGRLQWQTPEQAAGMYSLNGQLKTRGLELGAFSAPSQPVLSGRLEADSTLRARAASLGGLLQALQTQSKFHVRNAVLHGLDLARAVKTIGISRGGETPLDTLAGQLVSQGRVLQFSSLVASSGVLSANGHVAVSARQALSGRVSVDLAASALGGAVSVPLLVGGSLDAPEVTLTRAALIGAALGTAVLPGVGTGAGASLGEKLDSGVRKFLGR